PLAGLAPPLGTLHPLALLPGPDPSPAMALAELLREGPGWAALEAWGSWAVPGESRLRLPLPAEAADTALRVFLELAAPPEGGRFGLRATRERNPVGLLQRLEARPGERLFAMLTVPPGEGDLMLAVEPAEGAGGAERVGVCSLMACRADDHAARLDYLEGRALARLPPG
ncbi:hypothetical protein, partial [Paracraurococcus ruber]|uniref:hypothetical protein n=1 Tax=Paracraurococcus ruber TaxID=77675 RepID=UPI0013051B18